MSSDKPRCPKCGHALGILVKYVRLKIHSIVRKERRPWTGRVLKQYPEEQDDVAEQWPACLNCDWRAETDFTDHLPFVEWADPFEPQGGSK